MKYFFDIAYLGTNYHGWQSQKNALGIQQIVSEAISLKLGKKVNCVGSSRTDTGVHARGQVFHVEVDKPLKNDFQFHLNSFLPVDIAVTKIRKVIDSAHSRYDAISRSYQYRITRVKDPFNEQTALFLNAELDVKSLQIAAKIIKGKHDFTSFSRVKTDVKDFTCNIKLAQWEKLDNLLIFNIRGDRFLRGMVRALVGTMLEIGQGKRNLDELPGILETKDRRKAGPSVPAKGLTLLSVGYPENIFVTE